MGKSLKNEAGYIASYTKRNAVELIAITVMGIFSAVAGVAFALLSKKIVDGFMGNNERILYYAISIAVLGAFMILTECYTLILSSKVSLKTTNQIRQELFEKLLETEWKSTNNYHSGDLLNRLTRDCSNVVSGAVDFLPVAITSVIEVLLSFSILVYYDWTIAILTVALLPILVLVSGSVTKRIRKYNEKNYKLYGKNQSFLQESLQNLLVIKTFSVSERIAAAFKDIQSEYYDSSLSQTKYTTVARAVLNAVYQFMALLIFGWCVFRFYDGGITSAIGTLVMLFQLISRVQAPAKKVLSMIPNGVGALTSSKRLLEIIDLPEENVFLDRKVVSLTESDKNIGVSIKNVSFSYEKDKKVLNNLNIEIESGKKTAIVGPSGEGKTTLIRLLLGLITPDEGEIRLDCEENITVGAKTRMLFGYVPQGNTLFSGTIRENLLQGNPAADDEMLKEALMASNAEFVFELKGGLDSVIGERATGLSEGQAQRIAIARALIRNAKILILDEATSALDSNTEKRVLEGIEKMYGKKTILMITHREQTAKMCDNMYSI